MQYIYSASEIYRTGQAFIDATRWYWQNEDSNRLGIVSGGGSSGDPNESKGNTYMGIRNPSSDFTNAKGKSTLQSHFDRHGSDFSSADDYLNGARNFLEKPVTLTTQSFISNEGTYFRYDTFTNEFGIMNKYGGVSTYFKPDSGINYWLIQIELYAPK